MKTIIAGSREIADYLIVRKAIEDSGFTITEVVNGCARGVDLCGTWWATANGVPVKDFPADWANNGKAAGPMRNVQMAEYAEALVAVLDGESKGTKHMIETALKHKLRIYVHRTDDKPPITAGWKTETPVAVQQE